MADRRRLSVQHATALVVANMIGTGIFTTSGFLIADLGRPLLVIGLWAVGGLVALSGALVYAELGAAVPEPGAEVAFLSRAFHPAVGFAAGWVSILVGFAAPIAASAMACADYLQAALPGAPPTTVAVALIVVVSLFHATNVRLGGRFQLAVTAVKVVLLVALLFACLGSGELALGRLVTPLPDVEPSWGAAAVSLVFVSYAYSGWNGAAYVASEIEEPGRRLPIALLTGTVVVTALYLALNLVFFTAADASALAGKVEVGHVAAAAALGTEIGRWFSLAISLALVSSVSAMVLAGPRVAVALAERGFLPAIFAERTAGGAPAKAVIAQAGLACVVAATATFDDLLVFVGFSLSVTAALTVIGAWRLRHTEPDLDRPFRAPLWPLPVLIYVALAAWMVGFSLSERPAAAWAGLGVVGIGLLGLVLWRRGASR